MEVQREKEETEARERKEELEVHCDPHYFRRNEFLILSQKEKKQKELEHKKKGKEVREHKEKLEVCHDPHLFRQNAILTPSQNELRQRELEREEEKKAKEHKEKLEVRATLLPLTGCHSNPIAEGKEAKGTCTREGREGGWGTRGKI